MVTDNNKTQMIGTLSQNQNLKTAKVSNEKYNHELAMTYYNEVVNQAIQEYYNKASGCSVKAQKDNLFNYDSLLEVKAIRITDTF